MSNKHFGRSSSNQGSRDPLQLAAEDQAEKKAVEAEQALAVEEVIPTETASEAPVTESPSPEEVVVAEEPKVEITNLAAPQEKTEQAPAEPVATPVSTVPAAPVRATQNVATSTAPISLRRTVRESTPTVTVLQKPDTSTSFEVMMSKEKKQGTIYAQNLIAFLDTYVVKMKPRVPVTEADVRQYQEGLVRTIRGVLESSPTVEFPRLWNILVAYFGEYKTGAFSPMYVNRGPNEWKRSPDDYNFLVNMTNLLAATVDEGRAAARSVDLMKSTKVGVSQEARDRLAAFYKP